MTQTVNRCKARVPTASHPLMLNALTHHGTCVSFLGLPRCSTTNWMTSNTLSLPSHRSRSRGLGPGCPWSAAPPGTPGEGALLPLTVSAAPGALGWACGVGGASQDSAGFGAMEEGLISREGRNLRLPLRFGLRPQGPCRVGIFVGGRRETLVSLAFGRRP